MIDYMRSLVEVGVLIPVWDNLFIERDQFSISEKVIISLVGVLG